MKNDFRYSFEVDRIFDYDTVVIGGGLAGCAAAIASARHGAKTLLVEADGTLGGQAGVGLVTPMDSVCDKKGVSFGGLAREIKETSLDATRELACPADYADKTGLSPTVTKFVLVKMVTEAGAAIRFHTTLISAQTDGGRVEGVVLHDKSGFLAVRAKTFIDATGDADLVASAGDDTVRGSEPGVYEQVHGVDGYIRQDSAAVLDPSVGKMQPVSLFFTMGGVDLSVAMQYNNRRIPFSDEGVTREAFLSWKYAGTEGFKIVSDVLPTPQNRILLTPGRTPDEAVINMSRIVDIDGSDGDSLSRGEIAAQLQIPAVVSFLQRFAPGFEHSFLRSSSSRLGVRESRRLVGRYVLTGRDVMSDAPFSDTVCRGYYLIDIHDPSGKHGAIGGVIPVDSYRIPFRSICSRNFGNLLAVGRCMSADHVALSATRIQGSCILTGQAAGTAAALSLEAKVPACDVRVCDLQAALREDGVRLD